MLVVINSIVENYFHITLFSVTAALGLIGGLSVQIGYRVALAAVAEVGTATAAYYGAAATASLVPVIGWVVAGTLTVGTGIYSLVSHGLDMEKFKKAQVDDIKKFYD